MVRQIPEPRHVPVAGSPHVVIEELVGRLVPGNERLSIARMRTPAGWSEPSQRAPFDEYTLVVEGALVMEGAEGIVTARAGEAFRVMAGDWVAYSSPNGAEYVSVRLRAHDLEPSGTGGARVTLDDGPLDSPAKVQFEAHGPGAFDRIEPLWEELARYHVACAHEAAPAFETEMAAKTFEARRADLLEKNRERLLLIDLAVDPVTGRPVGYCVSSAAPGQVGEVESIAVTEPLRGRGIGSALLDRASEWMDGVGVTEQSLSVFAGNNDALPFYARHGFVPRYHLLVRRE